MAFSSLGPEDYGQQYDDRQWRWASSTSIAPIPKYRVGARLRATEHGTDFHSRRSVSYKRLCAREADHCAHFCALTRCWSVLFRTKLKVCGAPKRGALSSVLKLSWFRVVSA